jgi:tetratricopeptide (TPR) repeat protein
MSQQTLLKKAESYCEQAEQFQEQGNIENSIASYQEAIKIKPNYGKALNQLAAIYESQENWAEVAKCCQSLIGIKPDNPYFYLRLAKALNKQGKVYGAIAAYQEAIELNSEQPAYVYHQLGNLLLEEKNELKVAIDIYENIDDLNPNFLASLYTKFAKKLQEDDDLDEAIVYYQKAIKLQPDFPNRYRLLGDVFLQKQYFDEAVTCYKKAIKIKPDFPVVYQKIGDVYQQKGELDIAVQCYQKVLEFNPNATYIYRLIGNILTQQGRVGEAQGYYMKAL